MDGRHQLPALVPPHSLDMHDNVITHVDDLNLDDQSESDMSEHSV